MITSRQNQRLKDIRHLRRSKGDQALLEGAHLVEEGLAAGLAFGDVLMTPEFLASDTGRQISPRLPHPPLEVEAALLRALGDVDSPQGVLAVVDLPRGGLASLSAKPDAIFVYAEGLQDPGNLGALARVAEASGAAGLVLSPGTVHPNHPRALRASAGSLLRLRVAVDVTPAALGEHLRAQAPRWLCLAPRGGVSLWDADLSGCLVLAIGAEGPGLSPALEALADFRVTIPLEPPVESLNATVAAALALFEIRRRTSG